MRRGGQDGHAAGRAFLPVDPGAAAPGMKAGRPRRGIAASGDLEHTLDLDRGIRRQHGDADGRARMAAPLAEDLDRHHLIGHTFLMADHFTSTELRRTWDHQLFPLIEEYYFDQPDRAGQYSLERFWPRAE